MLKKIQYIKKLGVFNDFNWDTAVKNKGGAVQNFVDINIIYGRNYSGKTTLSRIARALETGKLSDKYGTPEFQLNFTDNTDITLSNITTHSRNIRVFSEDFIRDNLRFITNPDDDIEPFAILGDDNNKIEDEIKLLEAKLGMSVEGSETGLFSDKKKAIAQYKTAYTEHSNALNNLERQLSDKATNKDIGIKYKAARFGDQNYTIAKLKADIKTVMNPTYQPVSSEQVFQYEKLIEEKVLPVILDFSWPNLSFSSLAQEVEKLITKPISGSDKIQALVEDAILNRWVNEGRTHHRNKPTNLNCAFCDNEISNERWAKLDKHFDDESEQLEKSIDALNIQIESEKKAVNTALTVDQSIFYSKFHSQLIALDSRSKVVTKSYLLALEKLARQLNARKEDILNAKEFELPTDYTVTLTAIWQEYRNLCAESDSFRSSLTDEQAKAQISLRLKEVSDYLRTINYQTQVDSIELLEQKFKIAQEAQSSIDTRIATVQETIIAKKSELHDEEKGAKKVNAYLNNYFGHQFLTLEAKNDEELTESSKSIRFEVIRDGKKAYHLSEGECSLLAFCYFLAKLDDVATKDLKPIIWIDDPISSLDGNHIFFIYSLLNAEIVEKRKFAQLIISTHNLDFLKYLKRLKDSYPTTGGKMANYQKAYFIVVRQDKESTIQVMPSYLKNYVTEFNYLFHQIHKCASLEAIDDTNYVTYYNFANNARKFFEIYLYYKYPDQGMTEKTLCDFFGRDNIPAILMDRINNEYSHLSGVFERGASPVEVPEMQTAAKQIIKQLKNKDNDQFTSLMNSVGEQIEM